MNGGNKMNLVILTGRNVREVEVKSTQSGMKVALFTMAVDRPVAKDKEKQSDFINIVAWDKLAETCEKFVTKGMKVLVEGRLQTRNYDDKDGKKVYVTEIVATKVEFLDKIEKKQETSIPNAINEDDMPW